MFLSSWFWFVEGRYTARKNKYVLAETEKMRYPKTVVAVLDDLKKTVVILCNTLPLSDLIEIKNLSNKTIEQQIH